MKVQQLEWIVSFVENWFLLSYSSEQNIKLEITNIILALEENPERKFSQVEIKFFQMWWDHQSETKKEIVRKMVQKGQLEIVSGGWSMNDEACTTADDIINNMVVGHEWVLREFGVKPRIGWQIDPFGHSNTNTRLFAEMGFDALFFARIDFQDKERRLRDKELEWIWFPNLESLGPEVNILAHTFYHHYSAPDVINPNSDRSLF